LDEYYCTQCKKKSKCYKKISFMKPPEVLVIHLKRFEYDKFSSKKEKIEEKIKFPVRNLNMTPYLNENVKEKPFNYNLFGVINHSGSLSSGHYTARCCDELLTTWYNYDDFNVKELKEETINAYKLKGSEYPYVLFYKRTN